MKKRKRNSFLFYSSTFKKSVSIVLPVAFISSFVVQAQMTLKRKFSKRKFHDFFPFPLDDESRECFWREKKVVMMLPFHSYGQVNCSLKYICSTECVWRTKGKKGFFTFPLVTQQNWYSSWKKICVSAELSLESAPKNEREKTVHIHYHFWLPLFLYYSLNSWVNFTLWTSSRWWLWCMCGSWCGAYRRSPNFYEAHPFFFLQRSDMAVVLCARVRLAGKRVLYRFFDGLVPEQFFLEAGLRFPLGTVYSTLSLG